MLPKRGPMAFFDSTGAIAKPDDWQRPDWMTGRRRGLSAHQDNIGMTVGPTGLDQDYFMNWTGGYVTPPAQEAATPATPGTPEAAQQAVPQMQTMMAQPGAMQPQMGMTQPQNALSQDWWNQWAPRSGVTTQGYQNALAGPMMPSGGWSF